MSTETLEILPVEEAVARAITDCYKARSDWYLRRRQAKAAIAAYERWKWQPISTALKNEIIIVAEKGTKLRALAYYLGQCWRHAHNDDPLCFVPTHWMAVPELDL